MTMSSAHITSVKNNRALQRVPLFRVKAKNAFLKTSKKKQGRATLIIDKKTEAEKKAISSALKSDIRNDHIKGLIAITIALALMTLLVISFL